MSVDRRGQALQSQRRIADRPRITGKAEDWM
jgi:hypothetical protein